MLEDITSLHETIERQSLEISRLKRKANEWKHFAEDLNRWHYINFDSDMDREMNKPNKPGYYRANND